MKIKNVVLSLIMILGFVFAYGQQDIGKTKAGIMELKFGEIRAGIVRGACEALDFNNDIIKKIDSISISDFCKDLNALAKNNSDDLNVQILNSIIKAANNGVGGLEGDNLRKYEQKINKFKNQLIDASNYDLLEEKFGNNKFFNDKQNEIKGLQSRIKSNLVSIEIKKTALINECNYYNSNDKTAYEIEYPNGIFKNIITSDKDNSSGKTGNKINKETNKEQDDFEKCDSWDNIKAFKEKYQNSELGIDQKGWDICERNQYEVTDLQTYLNIFGEGANYKSIAEQKIDEYNQQKQQEILDKCENWSDYKEALKQWPQDKAFIKQVAEECWTICDNSETLDSTKVLENYSNYFELFKDYNYIPHLKDAKQIVDKMSAGKIKQDSIPSTITTTTPVLPEPEEESNSILYIIIILLVLAAAGGVAYVMIRRKQQARMVPPAPMPKPSNTPRQDAKPTPKPEPKPQPRPQPEEGQVNATVNASDWIVVGASVKGNGHIEANMPCQDNHKFESFGNGWGVAVVSDGAGSAAHSETGSKVVAERAAFHFKQLVESQGWMKNNTLPTDAEWLQKSYTVLKQVRDEVEMVAKKNNVELKSLSATCLVVVFSPYGLLTTHVGDGRMGYKSKTGEWKAVMTPHKGAEANQTLFLVSEFWDIPNYVLSGVLVPESVVVREPVEAFTLMSDGCENTAWLCTGRNPETGMFYDQNKPFEGFFNPVLETLRSMHADNISAEECSQKWYNFIESGAKGFVKEQDDKTMIIGVNIQ